VEVNKSFRLQIEREKHPNRKHSKGLDPVDPVECQRVFRRIDFRNIAGNDSHREWFFGKASVSSVEPRLRPSDSSRLILFDRANRKGCFK